MFNRCYFGDAQTVLSSWAQQGEMAVDCVVTSPPYYRKRHYAHPDQIGWEASPDEYVERLRAVFAQVAVLLKPGGTLWLVLGDGYWSRHHRARHRGGRGVETQLKPKDLIGLPWRLALALALALQADGWYLRSDIIWAKPSPLPEPVRDRPTRAHEYVFLFSRSARYHYDAAAIDEPTVTAADQARNQYFGTPGGKYGGGDQSMLAGNRWRWSPRRNRRSVWSVPTGAYRDAHCAVFPPELVAPCIRAGWRGGARSVFGQRHDGPGGRTARTPVARR